MDKIIKSLIVEGGPPVQKLSIRSKNSDGTYNLYIRYEDGYEVLPQNATKEQVIQFFNILSKYTSLDKLPYTSIVQENKYYRPPGQYQTDFRYQNHFNIYD